MKNVVALLLLGISLVSCANVAKPNPKTIRVMVIDTGIQPIGDLKPYLSESNRRFDLKDTNGHGTFVAGLIVYGRKLNNPVCKNVKIYSCKYYDGGPTTGDCIERAIKLKVHVINFSGGGYEMMPEEIVALLKFKGTVIAAAGNEGYSLIEKPFYPAAYGFKNIIPVGNGINKDNRVSNSNYGLPKMIWRLGYNIKSFTTSAGIMTRSSGSSASTAIATHDFLQRACQRFAK